MFYFCSRRIVSVVYEPNSSESKCWIDEQKKKLLSQNGILNHAQT